ncbi:ATP-binding protein [Actinokineospora cianjurensis]|uniref:histidine kinase n=1 Tax=Actinokineospora cianjurensis TaxID=585224 RepID=A0A421AYN0_9PSEU|nr:ATP-binding protein [Actinokineospora cianjurensis]RLK54905.1 histidine kinase/DNA gyrase B/HSP90-like ATPase [Actinokineospora cianjurensis]
MTPEEIRGLFLFESLDDEQLAWLAEHGVVETDLAGTEILSEGAEATCFYVLLEGTVSLLRTIGGERAEISRTDHRGSYFGATQAYLQDDVTSRRIYLMTVVAVTDVRMLQLPAAEFGPAVRSWFPMGIHLLEGLFWGMQATQAIVGQRERLLALGSLTAGLTHELNNPAAAAVRATAALRERVAGMRHKLSLLASGALDAATLPAMVRLQEEAVERVAKAPRLSPMDSSDREDELADWLESQGISGGWDLAPTLVAGGLDVQWLAKAVGGCPAGAAEPAVRWLAYTVGTEALMDEIEDATTRMSTLLGAAKQYSQLDRAPFQVVDVHDLLDATLVMLGGKVGAVTVHKEYDRSVPPLPGYAGELNQVWTNLIDNALAAMGGAGTLTIRTSHHDGRLLVEVVDTGAGIPPEVVGRVFEPFFTTKPVGEGTGLGLDISWRIVVAKHHGDIRVDSEPGNTRFQVWLPLTQP